MNEFDGGTILRECPTCGQFCHVPKTYRVEMLKKDYKENALPYIWPTRCVIWPTRCVANSYCKRCKKKVKLDVVFI